MSGQAPWGRASKKVDLKSFLSTMHSLNTDQASAYPPSMESISTFTSDDFECSVYNVCPSPLSSFDSRECHDRFVGHISELASLRDWAFVAEQPPMRRTDVPCIVLVLESPHIDEYGTKQPYTPWPANGATGRHIRKRAGLLVPPCWNKNETQLYLINAIPYQCSLGQATRLYRSKVFREAWDSGARAYFQERLKLIYRQGDLVVNACTVGKPGPSLRALVEAAIEEVLPNSLRSRREHPFRWMSDEAVRRTWK